MYISKDESLSIVKKEIGILGDVFKIFVITSEPCWTWRKVTED